MRKFVNMSKSNSSMPELSAGQSNTKSSNGELLLDSTSKSLGSNSIPMGMLSKLNLYQNCSQNSTFNGTFDDGSLLDMYKNSLSYMIQELATAWTNSPGDPLFLHHLYRIQIANSLSDLDPYISIFSPCFEDPSSSCLVYLSQFIISKLNALFLYDTRNQRIDLTSGHNMNLNPTFSSPALSSSFDGFEPYPLLRNHTEGTDYVEPDQALSHGNNSCSNPCLHHPNKQCLSVSDECNTESGFNSRMSNLSTCDEGPNFNCHPIQHIAPGIELPFSSITCRTSSSLFSNSQLQEDGGSYVIPESSPYCVGDLFTQGQLDIVQSAPQTARCNGDKGMKKKISKSTEKNIKCQNEILMLSDYAQPMKGVSFNAKKQAWLAYWTIANNFQMRKFPIKKYGFRNAKQMAIQCRLEAEKQNTTERIERFREKMSIRTRSNRPLSPMKGN